LSLHDALPIYHGSSQPLAYSRVRLLTTSIDAKQLRYRRRESCGTLRVPLGTSPLPGVDRSGRSAAWLARLVRDQEVDGSNPFAPTILSLMVKKVVRRAEVKGHRHGFRVSGVLLIEAADNPRPVHKLCHQTQHPKQDHHLESPRARPESLPALSFDSSQQVVQKQEEKQQRSYVVPRPRMLMQGGKLLLIFFLLT